MMFLCVAICSLVFVNLPGLIVDAKSAPQTFAELQEYFEKEIQRIENKHEVEIQTLKREIHQERHERIRETAVMKARHEGALTEINKLKGQLAGNGRIIEKMYVHDTKLKEEEARYESVEEFIDDPKGLTIEKGRELTDAPGDEEDHGIKDAVENKRTIDTDTNKGINGKRQLNLASGSGVAFFAKLSKQFPQTNRNQTIVFDKVVTNQGNSYHSSHGIFTCTTPGLYVFSVTLMTDSQYAHAKLVKNATEIVMLYLPGHWEQSSHTVVIELKAGDLVSVESDEVTAHVDFSGYDYSSFSGFLLYDYSDVSPIVGK